MKALEYTKWENFKKVIDKAKLACKLSNNDLEQHFPDVRKVLNVGNSARMNVDDYKLTRYACYLIVQNADSRKKVVALGQTIAKNKTLYKTAKDSGVKNYGKFTNYGYEGLYGGENAKQIAKRNDNIDNEEAANATHHVVGKAVRETIKKLGGTMPENLPTPKKSISQIEFEELKKLKEKSK